MLSAEAELESTIGIETLQDGKKAIRLVEYLLRLASLRTKLIRDVADYQKVLRISDIPRQKECFTQAWGRDEEHDSDVWIEVQNRHEPELPSIPGACKDWINGDALRNKNEIPKLLAKMTRTVENPAWQEGSDQPQFIQREELLNDHPKIQRAWDRYVEEHWLPWTEQHNIWESIHRAYSSLFAIHQEQLRLGEEYELVLGLGLLTWRTPSSQRVCRHLIVANAMLEFEARLGRFTVRPSTDGASLRPELDMLNIEEQPARAEETAKSSLAVAADDPWEKDCIEGVLKALVHSISPGGEYDDTLSAKSNQATPKPIVEYAPALILRKRSSKGLTETLKRIKEKIEQGEDIPVGLRDLAEIEAANDRQHADDPGDTSSMFDGEVFFPKPSNEEQHRIVDALRGARGVLVQGPPGTGKSHTIANLVCHLLATGQRALVTAKTPRALQVLEGLLPQELRPLCINLLGDGLEEKHSLESSVGGILRKNEEWNEPRVAKERESLEQKLRELREEKARVDRRLLAIRESETHAQSIAEGTYRGTAARIAEAVTRDRNSYDWFTDDVPVDTPCPLSEQDLHNTLTALRQFTPETRHELTLAWPENLPEPETLANLIEREQKAIEEEARASQGSDQHVSSHLSTIDLVAVETLRDSLLAFRNKRQHLGGLPYPWLSDTIRDVTSGNPSLWRELLHVTRETLVGAEKLVSTADNASLHLPTDMDVKRLFEDADQLRLHLANGGKLGWGPFRAKAVREKVYLLKSVRVNGRSCSTLEQFSLLTDTLHVRVAFETIWKFWTGRCEQTQGPYTLQLQSIKAQCDALDEVLSLETVIEECRRHLRQCSLLAEPTWTDESQIERLIASCRHALAANAMHLAAEDLHNIASSVETYAIRSNAHPVTSELLGAIRSRDVEEFTRCRNRIQDLEKERHTIEKADHYLAQFRDLTPRLIDELERTCNDSCWDTRIQTIRNAWHWAQARFWIEEYIRREDAPSLAQRAKQIEDEINATIATLASLHAWSFCFSRLTENHRRHMEAWRQSMRHLGKGTGKHAPKHRREAQQHLSECREAVPAWVMPLHRVWDTVEPTSGMFDVIIVDEASQCGFEALPLLYLGKKILIVGDDKQISPEGGFVEKNAVSQLMNQFLYDFDFKSSFHHDASLFDHGRLRYGTRRIALQEHFRCMPEIIRFSNDLCYSDTPLIPLRQYGPERLTPLEHAFVDNGYCEGTGSRVTNSPEAEAVVAKIVELCHDTRYTNKSMGVVILQGEAQAGLIEDQLLGQLGAEEMERRRLICGNSYSFQGDERDVMFLSMVAAPNKTIGTLTKPADERRFNVAASRARDQMWLFHSVTCNDLSASCLRRRLLEFFENTKPQEIAGIKREELERRAAQDNRVIVNPPQPFDSWFEVDVALELLRKGFVINPQFEVAGKRIDLVVEGGQARLAVECDGDAWHGADRYEKDMQRQRILERCGWEFFRVRESAFYSNRQTALEGLWHQLEERGIHPFVRMETCESQTARSPEHMAADCEDNSGSETEGTEPITDAREHTETTRIGSTVVYINEDNGRVCQASITTDPSNLDWGMVNINTPIAKALLGHKVGDIIQAHLPVGGVRIRIVEIR